MAITDIVLQTSRYGTSYVTVTGGEPLSQPGCLELLEALLDEGYIVSLETSGALDVSKVDSRAIKVMDLKTPGSGEAGKNLYSNIACLNIQDQVKFVIGDDNDYQWAKQMMRDFRLSERCQILFSPVVPKQNPAELADKILVDRLPVRFQIQLHKILWGNVQGK